MGTIITSIGNVADSASLMGKSIQSQVRSSLFVDQNGRWSLRLREADWIFEALNDSSRMNDDHSRCYRQLS